MTGPLIGSALSVRALFVEALSTPALRDLFAVGGRQDTETAAGWTAFVIFILLGVAVAFLGWSLARQLRKAQRAKDAGVYGDEPAPREQPRPGDRAD